MMGAEDAAGFQNLLLHLCRLARGLVSHNSGVHKKLLSSL